jgi:hypothetical protein
MVASFLLETFDKKKRRRKFESTQPTAPEESYRIKFSSASEGFVFGKAISELPKIEAYMEPIRKYGRPVR